jgi:hypothetical protein
VTTPGSESSTAPAGDAALCTALEDVRSQIVELWNSGDTMSGREIAGTFVGGLALGIAPLLTGILLTNLGEEPPGALAALGALALLMWAVMVRGFWSPVRRRVHLYRGVRRLRRRERELIALLPEGTTGPGSYRRYYGERFSNPAMVMLYLGMGVVLLLILFR